MHHDTLPRCRLRTSALRAAIVAAGGVLLVAGLSAHGQELQITHDRSLVRASADGQPLLAYQYAQRPRKPYVKEWFSPSGVNILRDAPTDHLHHHGLMFAVAVDGVDFWSERDNCGYEKHVRLAEASRRTREGITWCTFTQEIDWVGPDAKTLLLKERRTIEACRTGEPTASVLVWTTSLAVPPGKDSVTLTGSPYFGLGMRFVRSMDAGGRFTNADGKTGVAGTNNVASRWCAYSAVADGKPVTVAIFDCPQNPRHPATWFTMDSPFAYLAATLNLHGQPLVVRADQPLKLRYTAALWDGHVEPATIETLVKPLLATD